MVTAEKTIANSHLRPYEYTDSTDSDIFWLMFHFFSFFIDQILLNYFTLANSYRVEFQLLWFLFFIISCVQAVSSEGIFMFCNCEDGTETIKSLSTCFHCSNLPHIDYCTIELSGLRWMDYGVYHLFCENKGSSAYLKKS